MEALLVHLTKIILPGLWQWEEIYNLRWSHQPLVACILSGQDSEGVCEETWIGQWNLWLSYFEILVIFSFFQTIIYSYAISLQVEAISEAFENFQLKTYGVKTQVHETPEKKKRRK